MKLDMHSFLYDDKGATAVEYAIMIALIAVAIIVAVTALGSAVLDVLFGPAANEFANF